MELLVCQPFGGDQIDPRGHGKDSEALQLPESRPLSLSKASQGPLVYCKALSQSYHSVASICSCSCINRYHTSFCTADDRWCIRNSAYHDVGSSLAPFRMLVADTLLSLDRTSREGSRHCGQLLSCPRDCVIQKVSSPERVCATDYGMVADTRYSQPLPHWISCMESISWMMVRTLLGSYSDTMMKNARADFYHEPRASFMGGAGRLFAITYMKADTMNEYSGETAYSHRRQSALPAG